MHDRGERAVRHMAPARRLRSALALDALLRWGGSRSLDVLDAGCQYGLFATAVARRRPDWRVTGVDVDTGALALAERWAREARVAGVTWLRRDLVDDLGTVRYDAVVSLEVLTELADPAAGVRRMAAALRSGGMVVVHVPEASWLPVLDSSAPAWRYERRHGYTHEAVRALLEDAGLRDVAVTPTTRGVVQLAQKMRDRIKDRSLKVRLAALPVMRAAVAFERRGLTAGTARGILVEARKRA